MNQYFQTIGKSVILNGIKIHLCGVQKEEKQRQKPKVNMPPGLYGSQPSVKFPAGQGKQQRRQPKARNVSPAKGSTDQLGPAEAVNQIGYATAKEHRLHGQKQNEQQPAARFTRDPAQTEIAKENSEWKR